MTSETTPNSVYRLRFQYGVNVSNQSFPVSDFPLGDPLQTLKFYKTQFVTLRIVTTAPLRTVSSSALRE